jgi:transposase
MGARLRVFLTGSQDKTLLDLRTADVPQKVKDRAEVIRLNAHGWYVEKIAAHFNWTAQTVREVLHRWRKQGLEGLWELPGRGGKSKWKEEDIVFLEECLKKEPRTDNSLQLAQKLESDRQIKLSPDRLRRVLKKRGSFGNAPGRATKENKTRQMNPIELEWQHLKKDELAGQMFDDELDLAYAVIDAVKARGEKGNYSTKRVKFNSNCFS